MTADPSSDALARIEGAIDSYLSLLCNEGAVGEPLERVRRLIVALDRLVVAYHDSPDVEPSDDKSQPPNSDHRRTMEQAAAAFPTLTWFAFVYPQDGFEQTVSSRDPILELSEIADDLLKVKWLAANADPADAIWDFRFGYQSHWGRHLHWVRAYLQDYYY